MDGLERMAGVAALFAALEDPRTGNATQHELWEILVIALCTMLCGGEDCTDMAAFGRAKEPFLRAWLPLKHGIPSHDTFSRVFRLLDPAQFRVCFTAFMRQFAEACGEAGGGIAVDGKTLRRSYDRAAGQSPLHLVEAWATDTRLTLGQLAVDGKSNEITAVPALLALLDLTGRTVTADAMLCQREIAARVVAQGGHYVLALKGNQPRLETRVAQFYDAVTAEPERYWRGVPHETETTIEKAHGRLETRRYTVVEAAAALPGLAERGAWAGLATVGWVERERTLLGGPTVGTLAAVTREVHFFISSLPPVVGPIAHAMRGHWGIENRLHWVLDVVLDEDGQRTRKDHGPENLALLRRLALNLAKLEPSKGSMKGKLKRAGWDNAFLAQLLTQFASPHMR